jgi:hypothetical protein
MFGSEILKFFLWPWPARPARAKVEKAKAMVTAGADSTEAFWGWFPNMGWSVNIRKPRTATMS